MNPSTRKRLVAAGVVATALTVAGTGVAMAANGSRAAAADDPTAADPIAVEAPAAEEPADGTAPDDPTGGLTEEQSVALWDAGYTPEDLDALAELWGTEAMETKSRLGQMLLDGVEVPVAPGSTPSDVPGVDQYRALWNAGYTYEDAAALAELWGLDTSDAKLRAGQALLDGETLPIAPGTYATGS